MPLPTSNRYHGYHSSQSYSIQSLAPRLLLTSKLITRIFKTGEEHQQLVYSVRQKKNPKPNFNVRFLKTL